MQIQRRTAVVDGLVTSYLEAGQGDPVVLLHGGEFGVSVEIGWEHNVAALAVHYRVLAPDLLGFGQSAKVIDFNDGRGMRIRHVARFCAYLGIESAHFIGNSMDAIMLLTDATSESPVLPVRSMVVICGGGEIQRNRYMDALYEYDATIPGMRRIVEALFPTLVVESACDKLLPLGWAKQIADQIRDSRSVAVDAAGHCPQIEQPAAVNQLLVEFLGAQP